MPNSIYEKKWQELKNKKPDKTIVIECTHPARVSKAISKRKHLEGFPGKLKFITRTSQKDPSKYELTITLSFPKDLIEKIHANRT